MKKLFPILFLLTGVLSLSMTQSINKNFVGTWDYEVTDTPNGDYKGQLVIEKDGKSYKGKMIADGGSQELRDLKIDGESMSFKIYAEDFDCKISLTRDGDTLKGEVDVDSESYPMSATKKK